MRFAIPLLVVMLLELNRRSLHKVRRSDLGLSGAGEPFSCGGRRRFPGFLCAMILHPGGANAVLL
jgi:hypothetical protein